jgi:hypothetical protein
MEITVYSIPLMYARSESRGMFMPAELNAPFFPAILGGLQVVHILLFFWNEP